MTSNPQYWPWWAGAIALAAIAVFHLVALRRLLGVSGSFSRVVDAATGTERRVRDDLVFLLFVPVGAVLATWVGGTGGVAFDLGDTYDRLIGDGAVVALLVGGALTGFGTRWARGCTSGHGLCGTSRLQRGSLVATATFFGVGIAVSWLLEVLS